MMAGFNHLSFSHSGSGVLNGALFIRCKMFREATQSNEALLSMKLDPMIKKLMVASAVPALITHIFG